MRVRLPACNGTVQIAYLLRRNVCNVTTIDSLIRYSFTVAQLKEFEALGVTSIPKGAPTSSGFESSCRTNREDPNAENFQQHTSLEFDKGNMQQSRQQQATLMRQKLASLELLGLGGDPTPSPCPPYPAKTIATTPPRDLERHKHFCAKAGARAKLQRLHTTSQQRRADPPDVHISL